MSDEIYENRKLISKISNYKRTKGRKQYANGIHVGTDPDTAVFTAEVPFTPKINGSYLLKNDQGKIFITIKSVLNGNQIEAIVSTTLDQEDES